MKSGDIIFVKVDDKKYETIIDEKGVQRFKKNTLLDFYQKLGVLDLNKIKIEYLCNHSFTKLDYAEFNMMLGYSVFGFAELSCFEDMEIKNPLWEEKVVEE